ncbi:MAG TPA: polyhydroxyalkanoic acid system family protein [Rhodanobacter sp.]|nr:polyhydroxyalkanoic acid system family protein [Rhodanobacter sp.]
MSRIQLKRPHQMTPAEARSVIDQIAARMREKFGMACEWQGDALRFTRPGVNGDIAIGASEILVNAELGLMLSPMKGMIEQEIQRKLDEHFA